MAAAPAPAAPAAQRLEQVVELFQNQRYRKFKVSVGAYDRYVRAYQIAPRGTRTRNFEWGGEVCMFWCWELCNDSGDMAAVGVPCMLQQQCSIRAEKTGAELTVCVHVEH